jgi:uncharacterized phiE125 gp8 family phage protein
MLSTVQITTPPAAEPVDLGTVRQHCRIDSSADDNLLSGYLTAARIMAEGYLSRALLTQTLLWTVRPQSMLRPDHSYLRHPLELPRAPVQLVESVTVLDDRGNSTAIQPATLPVTPPPFSGYIADLTTTPARLTVGPDTPLTGGTLLRHAQIQHVQVSIVAGYGAASDVPQNIIQAILMTTAFLYEHRGDAGGDLPKAAEWLLDRDRLQFFGG